MVNGRAGTGIKRVVGPFVLCALMLCWLWPIGLGGAMPVGGDVTQFQIGLMSVLGEALAEARLPFWNDRWGFGFPGVAESQMGVYYPPHLLAYGLLPVESAYTASMVVHILWGALGAYWASRQFGVSSSGAILSGLVWGASGFFLIHLPHQWAYSVGSWAPWAWGLAWSILAGRASRRVPWMLAAVMTIQILPGHFQLAFCTQVSLILMAIGAVLTGSVARRTIARRSAIVLACLALAFPMAAAQVIPTLQLARLAETQRDFEYLSGFAATPMHLVNLVAPDLFHRSPLWRPVAWDPFHTSPEELRLYVGLIPVFLAVRAIARPGPHSGAVRVLLLVLASGLYLSLGPYVPGFRAFSEWPGFSFFRAPARWGMIVTLALAILAGLGFDAIREGRWTRPGRWLAAFVLIAAAWIGVIVGIFELGLSATASPGSTSIAQGYDRSLALLPWPGDPPASEVFAQARRPQADLRVVAAQAREGFDPVPRGGLRLDQERATIYQAELGTTAVLLVGLLLIAPLAGRRQLFLTALVLLTIADLGLLSRRRPVDTEPIGSLTTRSVVLSRLAALPRGTRSIDPTQNNLSMVSGASAIRSYRTLDLPIMSELRSLAELIPADPGQADSILDAQRSLGARIRIIGPIGPGVETLRDRFVATGRIESAEILDDRALTRWLVSSAGSAYATTPEGRAGRYLMLDIGPAPRAWFLPDDSGSTRELLRNSQDEPALVQSLLDKARPLDLETIDPEHLELMFMTDVPGLVLIAQLDYPEWTATLRPPDGSANPAEIVRVLGGWQAIPITNPGPAILALDYDARSERLGLLLSALSLTGWVLGLVLSCRSRPPSK